MAWFLLKDQKSRNLRKGIHLRIRNLAPDLLNSILAVLPSDGAYAGDLKVAMIDYIKIHGLLDDGRVRLEVWASTHANRIKRDGPQVYTVIHLVTTEDPEWVCESDQGRGLVQPKKRST